MSVFRLQKGFLTRIALSKRAFSSAALNENEYTSTPQYPEILDLSFEKKQERKELAEYDEIKAVKTVEEKQIKLNMPRYYGFKSYMLREDSVPYDTLAFTQHITRTHLKSGNNLPDFYNNVKIEDNIDSLKSDIEEVILLELEGYQKLHDLRKDDLEPAELENLLSENLSSFVSRILTNSLSKSHSHLVNVQVDFNPRIESCWYAGGMNPPEHIKRCRSGIPWMKDKEGYVDQPTDRLMCYLGSANLTLRSTQPLKPLISASEAENPEFVVPYFQYDPRTMKIGCEHRHMANIPGFWPGDAKEFGLLSIHSRGHMLTRAYNDLLESSEAIHRQAILSSFAWLHAQANFLGFTTFNDITYPLVTQTVITNGKLWSFSAYQLNTIAIHSKNPTENPKRNICWGTPEMKLYEKVENGKLVGFNEETLRLLLKFYSNAPESRLGVNMKPYLSKTEKVSADYEHDEKREWLENEYKFLTANRPRIKLPYEIYSWEKIYKIDNQTRPMDKRMRPFELKVNPWRRTLDDRKPRYIPRAHRPHLPRWRGRDANEYFP